jgi:hypothetical protein
MRESSQRRNAGSPEIFQPESEDDEVLLVAVEFSDAWEESPSFEAEAFE